MQASRVAVALLREFMPFAGHVRRLKRRFVPYVANPTHSSFTLDDGTEMLNALRHAGASLDGDLLEVGSGWTPIIPMLFHLAGARTVTLTDLDRLYDEQSAPSAIDLLLSQEARVLSTFKIGREAFDARVAGFRPTYLCPWRPSQSAANTFDIAISRAVLEHIPPPEITRLFVELRRVVRPGGFMCHSVDNTDHWQHGSHGLGLAHFLRYPTDSLRWRIASLNKHGFMNRLRHSDYIAAARQAGWTILAEQARVPEATLEQVTDMQRQELIAPEFQHYSLRDLATTATLFVARRDG